MQYFRSGLTRASLLDEAGVEQVLDGRIIVQNRRMAGGQFAGDAELGSRVVDADLGDLTIAARRDDREETELAQQGRALQMPFSPSGRHTPLDTDRRPLRL